MIVYLFKSTLCLGILLLVYLLLLEKEKMHQFNRWYLLGSVVFALIVPLINIKTTASPIPVLTDNYFTVIEQPASNNINHNSVQSFSSINNTGSSISLKQILQLIYLLLTGLLLFRFIRNAYRLLLKASKNKTIKYKGAKLVLLPENTASYTFLNNIFIAEADYNYHKIEDELIVHELSHVQQKHSLDIIFIEILQTLFWFNPLFIFYKKAIQLNHEFLADDAVIKTFENIPAYQFLLFEKASANSNSYLASAFNYSVTKKRLVMMTRNSSRIMIFFKKSFVLILLTSATFIFSLKTPAQNFPGTEKQTERTLLSTQEGVSKEELAEFDAIIQKNMTKTINGHTVMGQVTDAERSKLETIYKKMSKEQQSVAKVIFKKRLPPFSKEIPTAKQLEAWKDNKIYGVWIDEKRVENEYLNKYQSEDFSHYYASKLSKTAINYGKHYVQIDLMTKPYYDKYYKSGMALVNKYENEMMYRIGKNSLMYIN